MHTKWGERSRRRAGVLRGVYGGGGTGRPHRIKPMLSYGKAKRKKTATSERWGWRFLSHSPQQSFGNTGAPDIMFAATNEGAGLPLVVVAEVQRPRRQPPHAVVDEHHDERRIPDFGVQPTVNAGVNDGDALAGRNPD